LCKLTGGVKEYGVKRTEIKQELGVFEKCGYIKIYIFISENTE